MILWVDHTGVDDNNFSYDVFIGLSIANKCCIECRRVVSVDCCGIESAVCIYPDIEGVGCCATILDADVYREVIQIDIDFGCVAVCLCERFAPLVITIWNANVAVGSPCSYVVIATI